MNIPIMGHEKAPFKLHIKSRSQKHAVLIERECAAAVSVKY